MQPLRAPLDGYSLSLCFHWRLFNLMKPNSRKVWKLDAWGDVTTLIPTHVMFRQFINETKKISKWHRSQVAQLANLIATFSWITEHSVHHDVFKRCEQLVLLIGFDGELLASCHKMRRNCFFRYHLCVDFSLQFLFRCKPRKEVERRRVLYGALKNKRINSRT